MCLKRVPDTGTSIRIDISGSAIDFEGVKYIISPYDEYAIELGLRQRDASDDGELALVTLGLAFFCWRRRHLAVALPLALHSLSLAFIFAFEVNSSEKKVFINSKKL